MMGILLAASAREAHAEPRDTGFFVRLSFGASMLRHSASADAHEVAPDVAEARTLDTRLSYTQRPIGFVGEAALGWSPRPGLALAALYIDHPYLRAEYGDVHGQVLGVNARGAKDVSLALYGALLSFHPDPSGPWHLGAAGGLAMLHWDNPYARVQDDSPSVGFALGPEGGAEGYAGQGFWLGVTARVLVGRATKDSGAEVHGFVVPTVLFTVTSVGVGRR